MPPSLATASIICLATSEDCCLTTERINEMTTDLVTYLSFDGHCEAAFKHYEKILGGKILMMARYADAPADAGVPQNPETAARIIHARWQVGDRLLMGADAPPQVATRPQ